MVKYIIGFLFFLVNFSSTLAQCPMCRSAVESSIKGGKKAVGMGLNNGILMLLATVYAVIFIGGFLWYRKHKQAKSRLN
jgi:hypothetical protein